jgi:hypothetical protein
MGLRSLYEWVRGPTMQVRTTSQSGGPQVACLLLEDERTKLSVRLTSLNLKPHLLFTPSHHPQFQPSG